MTESRRYKAFISYSHADEAHASWLQRALERYRTPKTLRRTRPDLPARLYPIFRDSAELATSTDLSESIQRAMDDSEALIVICSPAARASHWVNEEIRRFRASGRGARIFCLIVAGSPEPDSVDYAFPTALLQDDAGNALREPLAADVTATGGGRRDAMLRIAAGLLDVGIDALKRRDAQRQARFWSFVATGSLLVTSLTIGLALYAMHARREADVRRAQAEKLITYMLGDLRKNLERVGQLELLDSIGTQAMGYFAAIGERGTEREMLEPALAAFRQALSQTRALYDADPRNNDYLFELGQAEFWVGNVAWQRGDLDSAYQSMQRYMEYSRELATRVPGDDGYRLELSYAHSNLGSVAMAQGQLDVALEEFRAALTLAESLLAKNPGDYDLAFNAADTRSWIGTTLVELGRLAEGREDLAKAVAVIRPFHAGGQDKRASSNFCRLLTLQADADINRGELGEARRALEESLGVFQQLLANDPSNTTWLYNALTAEIYLLSLVPPDQWTAREFRGLERVESKLAGSSTADVSDKDYIRLKFRVHHLRNVVLLRQGDAQAALRAAQQTQEAWRAASRGKAMNRDFRLIDARIAEVMGRARAATGDVSGARETWQATANRLDAMPMTNLPYLALRRLLAIHLGDTARASEIGARLEAAGYRDPRTDPAYASRVPL